MCSCPNREKVLLTYQARVRCQWHDDLTRGQGFNIAPINQKLLSTIAEEVWDTVRTDVIKQVSTYSKNFSTYSERPLSPSPHLNHPSPDLLHAIPRHFAKPCHFAMHCHFAIPAMLPPPPYCHPCHTAMTLTNLDTSHPMPKMPSHHTNHHAAIPAFFHHVSHLKTPAIPCSHQHHLTK